VPAGRSPHRCYLWSIGITLPVAAKFVSIIVLVADLTSAAVREMKQFLLDTCDDVIRWVPLRDGLGDGLGSGWAQASASGHRPDFDCIAAIDYIEALSLASRTALHTSEQSQAADWLAGAACWPA
jgi:hypothetical protein